MLISPKVFRLKKVSLFPTLNPKTLYLVNETDAGYTVDVGESEWMTFPKSIVEKSPKIFSLYNRESHKIAKKKRIIFLNRKSPNQY